MLESNIQRIIRKEISPFGTYFRTNVGKAWTGNEILRPKSGQPVQVTLYPGDVLIRKARPFSTGMPPGASDINGMTRVLVTPQMVGTTLAVFTAIEVKKPGEKRTPEQVNYQRQVKESGGLCGVACSAEDALRIVQGGGLCP